jgi:hypothetical protein
MICREKRKTLMSGEEGWELIGTLANNVAYLKRQILDEDRESFETASDHQSSSAPVDIGVLTTVARGSDVKAKYRDRCEDWRDMVGPRPDGKLAQAQAGSGRKYRRLCRMISHP